jgi:hypothetical protein
VPYLSVWIEKKKISPRGPSKPLIGGLCKSQVYLVLDEMDKREFLLDLLLAPILGAIVDHNDLLGYNIILPEDRFQTREKILLRVPVHDDNG